MYTIYALVDERGTFRYIGSSTKDAAYVLSHHRSAAKSAKKRTPVNEWVLGYPGRITYKPLLQVEDILRKEELEKAIAKYRGQGHDLLNLTKEQHAAKVREAMAKPEVRSKISENGKGRVNSPEHRKAISEANKGRVISPEHKAIISATHKGKVTSEATKAKIAEKAMGHKRNAGRTHSQEAKDKMSHTRHVRNHVEKDVTKPTCRWCNPTT